MEEKTRKCYCCGKVKDITEFVFRNKSSNRRQYECNPCRKEIKRKQYQKNKKQWIKRVSERNARVRQECREKLWDYLSTHPCIDCGEQDRRVLQFDHVRGTKKAGVAQIVNRGNGWNSVLREIEKCEVRCANCHTKRTWERAGWMNGWRSDIQSCNTSSDVAESS